MTNNLQALVPNFQIVEMVWLLRCNIMTTRPCAKLDYTILGPFHISECINHVAYRLDLPPHYRIHEVFHVSLLEVYHPSVLPGRQPARPLPIELESSNEYEVEEILNVENAIILSARMDTRYLKLLGNVNTVS